MAVVRASIPLSPLDGSEPTENLAVIANRVLVIVLPAGYFTVPSALGYTNQSGQVIQSATSIREAAVSQHVETSF
eukprot:6451271-Amphidinium_carterae.1